jgi:glycosyltransferase involved in cell wall biosynthesis
MILHITSLLGGGVDRHVRDIVRSTGGPHLVWHVGERAEVMEIPDERYIALEPAAVDADPEAMTRWAGSRNASLAHVHSLEPKVKARARALALPTVVTLHDVLFLRPDAFEEGAALEPDPAWLEDNARFLRDARAIVAPSEFVADLARRHVDGIDVRVIPNGSRDFGTSREVRARPEFAEHQPVHVVAVLGAIGPHKGSDVLEALGRTLEASGIAIVVIGYLDRQLLPGWRVPGSFFIHGAYSDDDVPGLVRAYGAQLALFPNRAPESFSYALSDLWACGLPVLAAPRGALAERIRRHGGGWLLPDDFDAATIAARLRELFSGRGGAERARVKSLLSQPDPGRVPPLDTMARSLDALYDRFGLDASRPAAGDPAAIERLIASNIDGSIFRVELARLADEFAQEIRAHAETREASREAIEQLEKNSRGWSEKLERDIAALKGDIEREAAERRALGEENAQLRIHKAAFDLLPEVIRKLLLKRILNARS